MDCINDVLQDNLYATDETIRRICVGKKYQVFLRNHEEAKQKLRVIFFAIIKKKFENFDPEYDDELEYFLDVLEKFLEKDYNI